MAKTKERFVSASNTPPPVATLDTPGDGNVRRDRHERYLFNDQGKQNCERPYTRCTTVTDCLDDTFRLGQWGERKVAYGLSISPDLMAQMGMYRWQEEDKTAKGKKQQAIVQSIATDAKKRAGSSEEADKGTTLHHWCHAVVTGAITLAEVASSWRTDVAAMLAELDRMGFELMPEYCERSVIIPGLDSWVNDKGLLVPGTGGTFDATLRRKRDGKLYLGDYKTNAATKVAYRLGEYEMQLGVYSRGVALYNWYSLTWEEMPPVDQEIGIVINLPSGSGQCRMGELDLVSGWERAQLAAKVRADRRREHFWRPVTASPTDWEARLRGAQSVEELQEVGMRARKALGTLPADLLALGTALKEAMEDRQMTVHH